MSTLKNDANTSDADEGWRDRLLNAVHASGQPDGSDVDAWEGLLRRVVDAEASIVGGRGEQVHVSEEIQLAWATFLFRQACLPSPLGLSLQDLRGVRRLLLTDSQSSAGFSEDAMEMMRKAEGYFAAGELIRAEALVSLFQTQPGVAEANERNFFVTRRIRMVVEPRERQVPGVISQRRNEGDDDTTRRVRELREHANTRLIVPVSAGSGASTAQLDPTPPRVPGLGRTFRRALREWGDEHSLDAVIDELTASIREVTWHEVYVEALSFYYGLILSSERNRYDEFIPSFFRWFRTRSHTSSMAFLSELHRRSRIEEESIGLVIEDVADRFENGADHIARETSAEEVREHLDEILLSCDSASLAGGYYDLTTAVTMKAAGFPQPEPGDFLRFARLM